MQVHIFRNVPRGTGGPLLIAMFEDRKRIFVDLLDWDVPVIDHRFEIDAFDDHHCVYLVAAGEQGRHCGSMRLLPTDQPHILGNLFPQLVDGDVPSGPAIWEITRLCLPTRLNAAQRLDVRNRLISAMVDHALATGIHSLIGVVTAAFRRTVIDMGWECRPLGPDHVAGRNSLGAFLISIEAETPARLAATGIYRPRCAFPCSFVTGKRS